jgi:hypothetical protein
MLFEVRFSLLYWRVRDETANANISGLGFDAKRIPARTTGAWVSYGGGSKSIYNPFFTVVVLRYPSKPSTSAEFRL